MLSLGNGVIEISTIPTQAQMIKYSQVYYE